MRDPRTNPVTGDVFRNPAGGGQCMMVVAHVDARRIDFDTYTLRSPQRGRCSYEAAHFLRSIAPDLVVAHAVADAYAA
ncbi:MAG TPA: hypothetical protein VJ724_15050 [Tahibacter sp.]|nr:hypothetical protein [Tahibacter sp.]